MSHVLALSDEARSTLKHSAISGSVLILPPGLDRPLYQEIDKVLRKLGGRWERRSNGHVFRQDPTPQIDALIAGKPLADKKKNFGQFFTPEFIADDLVVLADLGPGRRVLEPSAGAGALVEAARRRCSNLRIAAVEIDDQHLPALTHLQLDRVVHGDFLEQTQDDLGQFDHVIMNPPFTRGADIDHVLHAWDFVSHGGLLCAITSPSWRFRSGKKFDEFRALHGMHGEVERDIPAGAFKESGTGIATVMVRWKKSRS